MLGGKKHEPAIERSQKAKGGKFRACIECYKQLSPLNLFIPSNVGIQLFMSILIGSLLVFCYICGICKDCVGTALA